MRQALVVRLQRLFALFSPPVCLQFTFLLNPFVLNQNMVEVKDWQVDPPVIVFTHVAESHAHTIAYRLARLSKVSLCVTTHDALGIVLQLTIWL